MAYNKIQFEDVVERFGEVFFVLDSNREYQVHGTESYEVDNGVVRVEGMQGDEWLVVEFPLDKIEHHYSHKGDLNGLSERFLQLFVI